MHGRLLIIALSVFIFHFISFASLNNNSTYHQIINTENQGGVLGFSTNESSLAENSKDNVDSLILFNYDGMPLKALQFKIRLGNTGNLIFKSISRGSSIPSTEFLFDYHVHKDEINEDGSTADVVSVVFLGWGTNVLLPAELHHIATINYDVSESKEGNSITSIELFDVLGATAFPVQDANISTGQEKQIRLVRTASSEEQKINLLQNYPNPFNPVTTISFALKLNEQIKLSIYNLLGQELIVLIDEYYSEGEYSVQFDATALTSGIYINQLQTPSQLYSRKMLLIK